MIYRLADALKYLHAQGVVHRDLKPENILVSGRDPIDVKLADFGTAGRMGPGRDKLLTHCGSLSYVAPEVLKHQPYGCEVDIWSLGVIIYRILSDSLPFSDPNTAVKLRKVKEGQYSFPREKWDRIDPDGTGPSDLIKRCLVVDPALRITAPKILQHPSPPRRPVHSALGMTDRLPDILPDSSSTDVTPESQTYLQPFCSRVKSISPPSTPPSRTDAASIQLWKELQRQKIQPPQIQPLPSPPSRRRRSSFSLAFGDLKRFANTALSSALIPAWA
eukprot:g79762.t1